MRWVAGIWRQRQRTGLALTRRESDFDVHSIIGVN